MPVEIIMSSSPTHGEGTIDGDDTSRSGQDESSSGSPSPSSLVYGEYSIPSAERASSPGSSGGQSPLRGRVRARRGRKNSPSTRSATNSPQNDNSLNLILEPCAYAEGRVPTCEECGCWRCNQRISLQRHDRDTRHIDGFESPVATIRDIMRWRKEEKALRPRERAKLIRQQRDAETARRKKSHRSKTKKKGSKPAFKGSGKFSSKAAIAAATAAYGAKLIIPKESGGNQEQVLRVHCLWKRSLSTLFVKTSCSWSRLQHVLTGRPEFADRLKLPFQLTCHDWGGGSRNANVPLTSAAQWSAAKKFLRKRLREKLCARPNSNKNVPGHQIEDAKSEVFMSLSIERQAPWTDDSRVGDTNHVFGCLRGGFARNPPKWYLWRLTRFMRLDTGREIQAALKKRLRQRVVYFDEWVRFRQPRLQSSNSRDDGKSGGTTQLFFHTYTATWAETLPVPSDPHHKKPKHGKRSKRQHRHSTHTHVGHEGNELRLRNNDDNPRTHVEKKKRHIKLKPDVPTQRSRAKNRISNNMLKGALQNGGGEAHPSLKVRRFGILPFELWCVQRIQIFWRRLLQWRERRAQSINLLAEVLIPCTLAKAQLRCFVSAACLLQRTMRGLIARRKYLPEIARRKRLRILREQAARAKAEAEATAAAARAEAAARAREAEVAAARAREERKAAKQKRLRAKKIAAERIRQEKEQRERALVEEQRRQDAATRLQARARGMRTRTVHRQRVRADAAREVADAVATVLKTVLSQTFQIVDEHLQSVVPQARGDGHQAPQSPQQYTESLERIRSEQELAAKRSFVLGGSVDENVGDATDSLDRIRSEQELVAKRSFVLQQPSHNVTIDDEDELAEQQHLTQGSNATADLTDSDADQKNIGKEDQAAKERALQEAEEARLEEERLRKEREEEAELDRKKREQEAERERLKREEEAELDRKKREEEAERERLKREEEERAAEEARQALEAQQVKERLIQTQAATKLQATVRMFLAHKKWPTLRDEKTKLQRLRTHLRRASESTAKDLGLDEFLGISSSPPPRRERSHTMDDALFRVDEGMQHLTELNQAVRSAKFDGLAKSDDAVRKAEAVVAASTQKLLQLRRELASVGPHATTIANAFRCYRSRKIAQQLRETRAERERSTAASRINATCRRFIQRKKFSESLLQHRIQVLEDIEARARVDFQSVKTSELSNAIQRALAAGMKERSHTYITAGESLVWLEEMQREHEASSSVDVVESFKDRAMATGFAVKRTESGFRQRIGGLQAIIRMKLSSRRVARRRVEAKLERQLEQRRLDRDADLLQANIFEALEAGLDDESDVYAEAGMLLNDLMDGGSLGSSVSTTPTSSPHRHRLEGFPTSSLGTPTFSFEPLVEDAAAEAAGNNDDDEYDSQDVEEDTNGLAYMY